MRQSLQPIGLRPPDLLRIPAKVISRSEAPSGCLFLNSTARYGPALPGRPTLLGRSGAGAKLGDRWGSRNTASIPATVPGKRSQAASGSLTTRSERRHRAFKTGRYRPEAVAPWNLPWLVPRPCAEFSCPVGL